MKVIYTIGRCCFIINEKKALIFELKVYKLVYMYLTKSSQYFIFKYKYSKKTHKHSKNDILNHQINILFSTIYMGFFWSLIIMIKKTLNNSLALLGLFFLICIDSYRFNREFGDLLNVMSIT